MSRLFITQREINFISDITKEVVSDVVGQKIYYFPISEIKTRVHDVYNESPEKVFDNPIELKCLVDSPSNETEMNAFGPERLFKLEVFVQMRDIIDRGINIDLGDFVQYGSRMFEIEKVVQIRNIFGQVENNDGIKLVCNQSRESQFKAKFFGPTELQYSDPNAKQDTFVQTRGFDVVDDKETHDRRAMQENGVLDKPISGPARVNHDKTPETGSTFYDET